MAHPVLKNVNWQKTLWIPTPEGITVTVHSGEYVIGTCFVHLVKRGNLEIVEEDITLVAAHKIKYEQK